MRAESNILSWIKYFLGNNIIINETQKFSVLDLNTLKIHSNSNSNFNGGVISREQLRLVENYVLHGNKLIRHAVHNHVEVQLHGISPTNQQLYPLQAQQPIPTHTFTLQPMPVLVRHNHIHNAHVIIQGPIGIPQGYIWVWPQPVVVTRHSGLITPRR